MATDVQKATQSWEYGAWGDFNKLNEEQLMPILRLFKSEDDIAMDSIKRNRYAAFKFAEKNKIENENSISEFLAEQEKKKLSELPAEYIELGHDELIELVEKSRARVDFDKYGEGEDWKLKNILYKRIQNKHGGISLAAFRELDIPAKGKRGGRGFAITFNVNSPLPTQTPDGVDPVAEQMARAAVGNETIKAIGRNKGKLPILTFKLENGRKVMVTMDSAYAIDEPKEAKAEG